MAQYVWKRCVQMPVDVYLRDGHVRPIRTLYEILRGLSATFDDLFGIASKEDLADDIGLAIVGLGMGEVPGRVEGLGQSQVLFGYYSS